MYVYHKDIPTYDANKKVWTTTSFDSQQEFGTYLVKNCFKEPGEYDFDISTKQWNKLAKKFENDRYYTDIPENSVEWLDFWEQEEMKCRLGVIWKHNKKVWYLTRCYYDLLNFCPIINKERGQEETFCSIRDVQYHLALYIKLAEIFHKYAAIVKRRQMLNSYYMVAKSQNYLWYEDKKTIKWLASDDAYIDSVNGSWKIFEAYKNHKVQHTPWERIFTPGEYPQIQQKEKVRTAGNKWVTRGNESTMIAKTLKKDPKKGVGGPTYFCWYEEGGIAPTADQTLQYMAPALKSGNEKVGIFVISGSVGDLKECEPLKKMIEEPDNYEIFSVDTKWVDKSGVVKKRGLFIPAQYGMPQAVDEFGNSLVDKALELLAEEEEQAKKLDPKDYILAKSQNPINLEEAFAYRNISEFDILMIQRRQDRIKQMDKEVLWEKKPIKCLLYQDNDGKIKMQTNNLPQEIGYPVEKTMADKRGVVTIFEEPMKNPPMYTYFAGVDPIEVGVTDTSKSVFSISIWKRPTEEEYLDTDGKKKIRTVGDKLVASWRGRFDSVDKTNEHAELLIRLYNAYTLAERNKPNFINHFQRRGLTHLLARENELPLFKDMAIKQGSSSYGFYKGSNGKASEIFGQFKEKFKEYLYAEYGAIYKKDKEGKDTEEVYKIWKGLDRIDDYWLLEEVKLFNMDSIDNFDRVISDFAGYYIMKLYSIQNGTHRTRLKTENKPKQPTNSIYDFIDTSTKYSNLLKY